MPGAIKPDSFYRPATTDAATKNIHAVLGLFYVVQQQDRAIIERFGRFHTIVEPGLHVKIPFIDRIVAVPSMRTDKQEFPNDAKTADNVTITLRVSVQYHVDYDAGASLRESGTYRSYYSLARPIAQMRDYIADALRAAIPAYTLDQVFEKKDDIARDINNTVAAAMANYGWTIVSTLITGIELPQNVEESMNEINAAQRKREAAKNLAEADKIKRVVEAEAEAEAMQKTGEGIAMQRKAIADGIADSLETIRSAGTNASEANLLFMYTQWIEMMDSFAEGQNGTSTIVLPADYRTSASMFEQMLTANTATGAAPAGLDMLDEDGDEPMR